MNGLKCIFFGILMAHSTQVWAWGDIGHGAVGAIAEKNLTPKGKAFVYDIIGVETLAIAAIWPDQVRSDDRFKAFSAFHFLEIPPQFTFSTLPDSARASSDAQTIISQAPDLIGGTKLNREQKMILLRYLVHVVGDIHQPLHVGNGLDMGANLCSVKWTNPTTGAIENTNLHATWDEKLIQNLAAEYKKVNGTSLGAKTWFGYKELSDMVLAEFPEKKGESEFTIISQAKVSDWYDESQRYHSDVYPDGGSLVKPEDRAYCKTIDKKTNGVVNGKFDAAKIPTLDEAYVQKSLPIIKKRILFAGYRLAGLINKLGEGSSLPGRALADDTKLIDAITLKNTEKNKN